MSRYPSKWINEIVDYCDIIFIHIEINEDIAELLNIIKKSGTKPGIAVTMETDISKIESVLIDFEYLLLTTKILDIRARFSSQSTRVYFTN